MTIKEIARAIVIIAGAPAPTQTIITGPKATLGKLFKITKYGSATLDKKSDHHNKQAISVPIKVPNTNQVYFLLFYSLENQK